MNKQFSTLIIDDELLARERLERLLLNFPEAIKVIGFAKNGKEAKDQITNLKPEVIFLDIQMPGLTGFQLLETLEYMPLIIFCTAHDEYALKAFETNSIDYLVKPVRKERLEKTIEKLQLFKKTENSTNILEAIKELTNKKEVDKKTSITVKKGDRLIFLKLEDVFCFEAADKYVNIIADKGTFITEKSLAQLEKELPTNFLRVHRSYVLNINEVEEVQKYFNSRFIVTLANKGKTKVTTGRTYNEVVKKWLSM